MPIGLLIAWDKRKSRAPLTLALYGVVFFLILISYEFLPKEIKKYYKIVYTLLEYSFFTFFFWKNIASKKLRQVILLLSILFFAFLIFYFITTDIKRLDSVPVGIETILIFVYIFFFFYELSKSINGMFIYNHYCFWLAVGILIYLGGSFFFYILIDHLTRDQVIAFGNLTFLAEILKNILFLAAIFIYAKFPISKSDKNSSSVPYLDMI